MTAKEALEQIRKVDPMNGSAFSEAVDAIEAELKAKDEQIELLRGSLRIQNAEIERLKRDVRHLQLALNRGTP